jgi:hypothetical protein
MSRCSISHLNQMLVLGNDSLLAVIFTSIDVWEHACKLEIVCRRWREIARTAHSFSRHLTLHRHVVNQPYATKWSCMRNFARLALSVGSTMQGFGVLESLELPKRAPNLEHLDLRGDNSLALPWDASSDRAYIESTERFLADVSKLACLARLVLPRMVDTGLNDTRKTAAALIGSVGHVRELDMHIACPGITGLSIVIEILAPKLTGLQLYVSAFAPGVDETVGQLLSHAINLKHLSVRGSDYFDARLASDQFLEPWTSDTIHVILNQALALPSLQRLHYWRRGYQPSL